MRISVITPTADQPKGMRLAEQYLLRQTVQPDEWIVVDDGVEHAVLTLDQTHIKLPRVYEGARSLANNVLEALTEVTGDVILVWEHDDWYAPNHIEVCLEELRRKKATGSRHQRYYNVAHRVYLTMVNHGSALCNTAFTADRLDHLKTAALVALETGSIGVDRLFWDALNPNDINLHDRNTVVGIKGLPGRVGLGIGHRPRSGRRHWRSDPGASQLIAWVGEDFINYTGKL